MRRCAGRGSRSDSELPPFDPCTASGQVVSPPGVGHAFTGSPPGWELHPHGRQVVRGSFVSLCDCYPSPCGTWLSVNGSHEVDSPAAADVGAGGAEVSHQLGGGTHFL